MDSTNNQTAAQAAGAPEPDAPAAEQPTKSAAETKLEGQLATLKTKSDGYKKERDTARGERDKAVQEVAELREASAKAPLFYEPYEALSEEQFGTALEIVLAIAHLRGIVTTTPDEAQATASTDEAPDEAPADEHADEHADTKALLKRMGLKQAWVEPNGQIAFDEKHLLHFYGEEGFQSLTVISAE